MRAWNGEKDGIEMKLRKVLDYLWGLETISEDTECFHEDLC